jgi:streptomycin 6-kinase
MISLPQAFVENIANAFGDQGRRWLQALPDLVAAAARRWELSDIQPRPDLSYNFVAFASRLLQPVVLKIGVPNRELTSEMRALRCFDGRGCARLLEADPQASAFLLERLQPGTRLSALADDDAATHIAADVILNLWRPAPAEPDLIQLSDWFAGFKRLRARFGGGTGPLDPQLVEQAERIAAAFFAERFTPMLIHGDLHHFNILSSGRGWLAIDPKGVIGPAAYEVGPLLLNPLPELPGRPDLPHVLDRRIAILSEHLGMERERLRAWALAHAVLSACWTVEEGGAGAEGALRCARLLADSA